MTKNVLVALLLIALSVVIMIFTKGDSPVNLIFMVIKPAASLVYLCFIALGVTIGVLLK
ncbi:MAG: hypothetical protein WCI95_04985 [bacterium]